MPPKSRARYTTYLVASTQTRPDSGERVVYAVMAITPVDALAAVRGQTDPALECAIVGSLSTKMAKTLKLKPGTVRAV